MILMWCETNTFVVSVTKQLTPEGAKKKGSKEREGFPRKLKYLVNMTWWHPIWVHFVFELIINVRLKPFIIVYSNFSLLHENDS